MLEQDQAMAEKAVVSIQSPDALVENFRMVTFSLGRKAYGIDIMQVKEISSAQRFTYVPNTPSFVRGVLNMRGEIIPVLDMRLFFNIEIRGERSLLDITRNNEIYESLIILTFDYVNIGIIVDSISHVVSIDYTLIQKSHPMFLESEVQYIDGIVDYNDQLYIILAMDRIIDPHLELGESVAFDLEATFAGMAEQQALSRGSMPAGEPLNLSALLGGGRGEKAEQQADLAMPKEEGIQSKQSQDLLKTDLQSEQFSVQNESKEAAESNTIEGESPELLEEEKASGDGLDEDLAGFSALNPIQKILARALSKEGIAVTKLNAAALEQKWYEWRCTKNIDVPDDEILDSLHNRKEFIELLGSKGGNSYWSSDMQEVLQRHFRNHEGNLNVWHAGCGNGQETYSLTASLVEAAPEANLQVRAADADLMQVAEAPLQSVGIPSELPAWLRPYLNEDRGSDGYTFSQGLKDRIIFEYQDVVHSLPHTKADLIVMRDLLSRYPEADQEYVLNTIDRSLKDEGILVLGDNEELSPDLWEMTEREPLRVYQRRRKEKKTEARRR